MRCNFVATVPNASTEREGSFDAALVRSILERLRTESTESLECDSLEIKGWCNDEKDLAEKVSEAAACLANASGGTVLVGISDEHGGRQKFSPCPYLNVTKRWLANRIHDLTSPSVVCSVHDVSDLLSRVLNAAGRNVFAVSVPKSKCFGSHLTAKGISRIRVGKECRPHFTAEDDRSKAIVPDLTEDDLSLGSIEWAMAQHERHFDIPKQQWPGPREFLAQVRLVEQYLPDDEPDMRDRLPLAALLLYGKQSSLARYVPFFETLLIAGEKTYRLRKNIVESVKEICSADGVVLSYLRQSVDLGVLKELLVNAYIHRCYRVAGPITIRVSHASLEIQSPGELPGGLKVEDLIYCVPVYRNLLLSEGTRFIGLCDKIGRGIDLVYHNVLSGGLPFPEFESEHGRFVARIPLEGSAEFAEFLRKRSQALSQLDEIIVLRFLWTREGATITQLANVMQRSTEVARRVFESMRLKNMVEEVHGDPVKMRLAPALRQDIETVFQSNQMTFDKSLWGV
jgi:ATP-dependent DNA helicase RecG